MKHKMCEERQKRENFSPYSKFAGSTKKGLSQKFSISAFNENFIGHISERRRTEKRSNCYRRIVRECVRRRKTFPL